MTGKVKRNYCVYEKLGKNSSRLKNFLIVILSLKPTFFLTFFYTWPQSKHPYEFLKPTILPLLRLGHLTDMRFHHI